MIKNGEVINNKLFRVVKADETPLITVYTCENEESNNRLVVQGKLIN